MTLIVVAGTVLVPAATGAPSATCAAAGEIRVRVVVDFGDAPGAPPGISDVCVPVADRTSGAELLAARARQLGTPQPRYDGGFLCAIDGVPESGCGRDSGADDYWSYWHGEAGRWTYANTGAATWRLRDGDVEGWRFAGTTAEAKAAAPRATATPCATVTATTTTSARTSPTTATAPRGSTTTAAATTPLTAPGAPATAAAMQSSTTSTTGTTTSSTRAPRVESASSTRDDSGNGAPVGLVVTAAAVIALGVAAGVRFRRRGDA